MPEIFDAKKKKTSFTELDKLKNSGKYRSQWGSLMVLPQGVNFESLDDDETILLLGRRHFITNIGWLAMTCVLFFVPFFWNEFPFFSNLSDNVYLSVVMLWYLGMSFYVLINFIMWFYNVYIVTDERLIDLDFNGILNKTINVTQISKIEDINYTQRGLLSSFFNFGDVVAQTSSEQRSGDVGSNEVSAFTFESVGDPNEVVRIVSELMEMAEEKTN